MKVLVFGFLYEIWCDCAVFRGLLVCLGVFWVLWGSFRDVPLSLVCLLAKKVWKEKFCYIEFWRGIVSKIITERQLSLHI